MTAAVLPRVALIPGQTPATAATSVVTMATNAIVRGLAVKSSQNGMSLATEVIHRRNV
jgi:hypothetical protein